MGTAIYNIYLLAHLKHYFISYLDMYNITYLSCWCAPQQCVQEVR